MAVVSGPGPTDRMMGDRRRFRNASADIDVMVVDGDVDNAIGEPGLSHVLGGDDIRCQSRTTTSPRRAGWSGQAPSGCRSPIPLRSGSAGPPRAADRGARAGQFADHLRNAVVRSIFGSIGQQRILRRHLIRPRPPPGALTAVCNLAWLRVGGRSNLKPAFARAGQQLCFGRSPVHVPNGKADPGGPR